MSLLQGRVRRALESGAQLSPFRFHNGKRQLALAAVSEEVKARFVSGSLI